MRQRVRTSETTQETSSPGSESKTEAIKVQTEQLTLHKGDRISITLGQETYSPGKVRGSFTVGPIAVDIQIQENEDLEKAILRIRELAAVMFETEFRIKLKEFDARMKEIDP